MCQQKSLKMCLYILFFLVGFSIFYSLSYVCVLFVLMFCNCDRLHRFTFWRIQLSHYTLLSHTLNLLKMCIYQATVVVDLLSLKF